MLYNYGLKRSCFRRIHFSVQRCSCCLLSTHTQPCVWYTFGPTWIGPVWLAIGPRHTCSADAKRSSLVGLLVPFVRNLCCGCIRWAWLVCAMCGPQSPVACDFLCSFLTVLLASEAAKIDLAAKGAH